MFYRFGDKITWKIQLAKAWIEGERMEKKRSSGVIFWAFTSVIWGAGLFIMEFHRIGKAPFNFILAGLIFSVTQLILGIGLALLKEWPRIGFILLNIFCLLICFFVVVIVHKAFLGTSWVIQNLLSVLSIYFFIRPKVKEQFG